MISFLKLIRLPNLLLLAFAQYMVRFFIIQPILKVSDMELQMAEWEFAMLVLASVFIAAGGYIINDYFDVKIDSVNKPDDLLIEKSISRRAAIVAHAVLSFAGFAAGVFLSWKSGILVAGGIIFALAVLALWYYSTSFKYQFLTGNIVVSLLTAIAVFLPAIYETPRIAQTYDMRLQEQQIIFGSAITTNKIMLWGAVLGIFAFVASLLREIIKDMQDVEGDALYGCRTLPVTLGMSASKIIVLVLIAGFFAGCVYLHFFLHYLLNHFYSNLYIIALIELPLVALFILIAFAKYKSHFYYASVLIKLIMLSGIAYLFVLKNLLVR